MKRPVALDLFCCQGGAAFGLDAAGFQVVGVDIVSQPNYPFPFIRADAVTTLPAGFDFVWASPPCQAHTLAQRIQGNEHPDLIEPTRAMLRASGIPYVIENVVGAPLIDPIILCGAMFNLGTYRHRLFECSFPIEAPPHPEHDRPTTKMGRPVRDGEMMHIVGNFSGVDRARDIMGTQWMNRDGLREAIPPAFAEYIGRAAIAAIQSNRSATCDESYVGSKDTSGRTWEPQCRHLVTRCGSAADAVKVKANAPACTDSPTLGLATPSPQRLVLPLRETLSALHKELALRPHLDALQARLAARAA